MRDLEVDVVIRELLVSVKEALGGNFLGLYLYGSLATGGFTAFRSDIDFLVVTKMALVAEEVDRLKAAHGRLWASGSKWAARLEGMYLPLQQLRRHVPSAAPVPTVNEGQFYMAEEGIDWVIQRHVLREWEAIIEGPSLRPYIDAVSGDDLQSAVLELLDTWWAPMLTNPERLASLGYRSFAVLSMCRALFLIENGTVVSKEEAASWATSSLPSAWTPLIAEAVRWREGDQDGPLNETLAFIRYAIDRSHAS